MMFWFTVIPLVMLIMIVGAAIYVIVSFLVKLNRSHEWCELHPGIMIGSAEWGRWCDQNGVRRSYFL